MSHYSPFVLATVQNFLPRNSCRGAQDLLLVIQADQHTDEFARQLTVVLVEPLQVCNKLDVGGFEARRTVGAFATPTSHLRAAWTVIGRPSKRMLNSRARRVGLSGE
jgi:hypothetical protein